MKFLLPTITSVGIAALVALSTAGAAFADVAGTFKGENNHVVKGGVTVVKNADGTATVTLGPDFFLDGAPDPRVGFGKDGKYVEGTTVGLLKANTGEQTFTVPASINVDDFNEVYIWCLKFTVSLGVAKVS